MFELNNRTDIEYVDGSLYIHHSGGMTSLMWSPAQVSSFASFLEICFLQDEDTEREAKIDDWTVYAEGPDTGYFNIHIHHNSVIVIFSIELTQLREFILYLQGAINP